MTKRLSPRFTLAGNRYTKRLENRLVESLKEYGPLLEGIEIPKKGHITERREFVAEELIKKSVNKYTAYAIASRIIKK